MTSAKKPKRRKKIGSVAKELGAIHQWMKDHEEHDDRRFEQGAATMKTLATKDDIQTVLVDQASKADMTKLNRLLLTEDGEPQFATKADMQPLIDLYKGGTFAKSLLAGAAFTIITISALGYAIISIIGWIRGA